MGVATSIQRIENLLIELIQCLSSRDLQASIQSTLRLLNSLKILKRVSIFTKSSVLAIEKLSTTIDRISGISKEKNEDLESLIADLAISMDGTLRSIFYIYSKLRLGLSIAIAVYTYLSLLHIAVSSTENYIMVAQPILWLGALTLISLSLGLSLSILAVPMLPLTTILLLILLNNISIISLLNLAPHLLALFMALTFISSNINNYRLLDAALLKLSEKLSGFISIVKVFLGLAEYTIKEEADIHLQEVYGDKAFELIKYISDMQKLETRRVVGDNNA